MGVSAKGRVEHQKQNETPHVYGASGFVLGVSLDSRCRRKCYGQGKHDTLCHFSTSRIELRKKRNQTPCKEGAFDFFDNEQRLR